MSWRSWQVSQGVGVVVLCAHAVRHEANSRAADINILFVNDFLISRFPLLKDFGFGPRRTQSADGLRLVESAEVTKERDTPPRGRARAPRAAPKEWCRTLRPLPDS